MIDISYIKALHIIFVVTWFAGLFYIVRLFVYHIEANARDEPVRDILQTQYKIMQKRLWYIITWPSAILVGISAAALLAMRPEFLSQPWMHVKLLFVACLYAYHFYCHHIFKRLQNDQPVSSPTKMRIWNEVATMLLFAIVFLVVLKSAINWVFGVLGLLGLSIIMMIAIKLYKKTRDKP